MEDTYKDNIFYVFEYVYTFLSRYSYTTTELNSQNPNTTNPDDRTINIILLATAFNAIMVVGPLLTLLYNVVRLWTYYKQSGDKMNAQFLTLLCLGVLNTEFDPERDQEHAFNRTGKYIDKDTYITNPDVISSVKESVWQTTHAQLANDIDDLEVADDYIMKLPSSSTSQLSDQIHDLVSIASQDETQL